MKRLYEDKCMRINISSCSEESEDDEPACKAPKSSSVKYGVPTNPGVQIIHRKRSGLQVTEEVMRVVKKIKTGHLKIRVKSYVLCGRACCNGWFGSCKTLFQRVLWKLSEKCLSDSGVNTGHLQILFRLCVNFEVLQFVRVANSLIIDFPTNSYSLLENILFAIRGGIGVSPSKVKPTDKFAYEDAWKSVTQAASAAFLTLLYLVPLYPKSTMLENIVDTIIIFCDYQVVHTIAVALKKEDTRGPRGHSTKIQDAHTPKSPPKDVQKLYKIITVLTNLLIAQCKTKFKSCHLVSLMIELAVLPAFPTSVFNMQKYSLHLTRVIVRDHRESLPVFINKIFSQSSDLVNQTCFQSIYHLDSGKHVQMNTILILHVIQSSVRLSDSEHNFPENPIEDTILFERKGSLCPGNLSGNTDLTVERFEAEDLAFKFKMGKAVFIMQRALQTSKKLVSLILSNFFNQHKQQSESQDETSLQEFLKDLLTLLHEPRWPASEYILITFCTSASGVLRREDASSMSWHPLLLKYLTQVLNALRCDLSSSDTSHIEAIIQCVRKNYVFGHSFQDKRLSVKPDENVELLQKILLTSLIGNRNRDLNNYDVCQFYLANWFTDMKTEKSKRRFVRAFLFQQYDESDVDIVERLLSGPNKKKAVGYVNKIRRSEDILNISLNLLFGYLLKSDSRSCKRAFVRTISLLDVAGIAYFPADVISKMKLKCFDKSPMVRKAALGCLSAILNRNPMEIDSVCDILLQCIFDLQKSIQIKAVEVFTTVSQQFWTHPRVTEICITALKANRAISRVLAKRIISEDLSSASPGNNGDKKWSSPFEANVALLVNIFASTNYRGAEDIFLDVFQPDWEMPTCISKQQVYAFHDIIKTIKRRIYFEEDCERLTDRKEFTREIIACVKILTVIAKILPRSLIVCDLDWKLFSSFVGESCCNQRLRIASANLLGSVARLLPCEKAACLKEVTFGCYDLLLHADSTEDIVAVTKCLGKIASASKSYYLIEAYVAALYVNLKVIRRESVQKKLAIADKERFDIVKRSLALLGSFVMSVNFNNKHVIAQMRNFGDKVILESLYYCDAPEKSVVLSALFALGCIGHVDHRLVLDEKVTSVYVKVLTSQTVDELLQIQVLTNINELLSHMLKEISSDIIKGLTSSVSKRRAVTKYIRDEVYDIANGIVEAYFEPVTGKYLHAAKEIRSAVFTFITLLMKHKVIHRIKAVPYIASMTADPDARIRLEAELDLREIEKKQPGLTFRSALKAMQLSFQLHLGVAGKEGARRGFHVQPSGNRVPVATNDVLFSIVSSSESHHEMFISSLLREFDCSKVSVVRLLFLADNLAYFRYKKRRDVLSLMSEIDTRLIPATSCDSDLIDSFRGILRQTTPIKECERKIIHHSLRVLLLLQLRKFIHRLYGIHDEEIRSFCLRKSYKLVLKIGGKWTTVTNKTDAKVVPETFRRGIFDPLLASELDHEEDFALGFSKSRCGRILSQMKKLSKEFVQSGDAN